MLVDVFETAFPNHDFGWKFSGANALGFCPFHADKHQRSMSVYTDARGRERWHCFAEGIGGGVVDLVLRSGIPETNTRSGANHWLVKKGFIQETEQQVKDRERNDAIRKFYEWTNDLLTNSQDAAGVRAYLASRKITPATLSRATVGYYPTVPEVTKWLNDNNLMELLGPEILPERKQLVKCVGSIIFFYRTSYNEFSRLKLRNVCMERQGQGQGQQTKDKEVMFLGKKSKRRESIGYFSWSWDVGYSEDAILVEGEFDAAALTSRIFDADEEAHESIFCFSGGGNLAHGVEILLNMGKKNIYLFPDNDEPGIRYAYNIAKSFPQTFIIIPEDYEDNDDPATWAANHTLNDLNSMFALRRPAFAWIGQQLASQASTASIEDLAKIKSTLIDYAKNLPATDRELFLKNYGAVAEVSFESLIEEVEEKSSAVFRKRLEPSSFGLQIKITTAKGARWEQISNVLVDIDHDVILDDGEGNIERRIVLKVSSLQRSAFVELSSKEFSDSQTLKSRIIEAMGSSVCISSSYGKYLQEACITLSINKDTVGTEQKVYTHTGWRDGKFYMPNGYVDNEGFHDLEDVRVELPNSPAYMHNFKLADPPADFTYARELIREHILKVFPYDITLPYLAHVFWTPVAEFIPLAKPVCLWVVGITGSFKTTFTGIMASFFGDFRYTEFETWRSTKNAIEKNGYVLKDMLYIVDDYKGIDISTQNLVGCIQSYGDRHGRGRLMANLENRKNYYIRGNMVSTAEDIPMGEASVISRVLLLKIPGRGNSDHLTQAQIYANMLPGVMAKYIQFLINKHINTADYEQLLAQRRKMFPAMHGRVSESLATNSIAWDLVAEFLGLEDLTPQYYAALDNVLATMNSTTRQEQAGTVYIDTLLDLLATGNFYLESDQMGETTHHCDTAKRIGWIRKNSIYIMASQALAEINKLRIQITGSPIKYSPNAIYEQLKATGVLIPSGKGMSSKSVKINGQSVRVIELRKEILGKDDETSTDQFKPTSAILRDTPGPIEENQ